MITDYRKTIDDAVYYNPKTDGKPLVLGEHCLITWDGVETFKVYLTSDGRLMNTFDWSDLTNDEAVGYATEYANVFDSDCNSGDNDD